MNTIAILPGGRKICFPSCKNMSRSTRRKRHIMDANFLSNRLDSGKERNITNNANLNLAHFNNSCVIEAQRINGIMDAIDTHDIFTGAAVLLDQYESLLVIKRCEIRKPG